MKKLTILLLGGVVAIGAAGCGGDDEDTALRCTADSECIRMGVSGVCLAAGACAFADSSCGSGYKVDSAAFANADTCLYGAGFDDAAWIPMTDRTAALGRGSKTLDDMPVPLMSGTVPEDGPGTPVDPAVVLFVRPMLGFDPAGFYIQGLTDGRAWLVAVDPETLDPKPKAGDVVRFVATETKLEFEQRQISGIADGSWAVYSGWTQDLEPYITELPAPTEGPIVLVDYLKENESRLFRGTVKLGLSDADHPFTTWNSAGPGHHYLAIDNDAFVTPEMTETRFDELELRFPEELAFRLAREEGLREGCTVKFGPSPMWRWNQFIEFNVIDAETQLEILECESDMPRDPLAIAETMFADDLDTEAKELWFELVATDAVDLSTCQFYAKDDSAAVPLADTTTMLAAGDRVVVVDSRGPTMPESWMQGTETVTPTYIEVPDLTFLHWETWADGSCGSLHLQVACGGVVVDRIAGTGCRGYTPANVAMAAPPDVEDTLSRNYISFCEQTTSFEAMMDATPVTMMGTPGAPNDDCF